MPKIRVKLTTVMETIAKTDWRINQASTYNLYSNQSFNDIPAQGDPFGIVRALVLRARLENSGVEKIVVESHAIKLSVSSAAPKGRGHDLVIAALCTAGVQYELV